MDRSVILRLEAAAFRNAAEIAEATSADFGFTAPEQTAAREMRDRIVARPYRAAQVMDQRAAESAKAESPRKAMVVVAGGIVDMIAAIVIIAALTFPA